MAADWKETAIHWKKISFDLFFANNSLKNLFLIYFIKVSMTHGNLI